MDELRPLVAGYRLDRYELLAPIASGGMASVWLARLRGKRGFEKLFAIKTIKTELVEDARFQEMFLDEARIASGIQHPNVAQILDLGEDGGVLYIVMEWVDGDSLAKIRRLAKKAGSPLPLGVALRVVADACAGLHAAHELRDRQGRPLGVVHRDVSPQNILVTSGGTVKVIDFGVAKARDRSAGDTATGVVKGKIRYMAPEQAQGHAIDRRADIWALGVCLYEILTGSLPFDNDGDLDVLRRLMSDEPAPRPPAELGEALREILAHSLVRDPKDRFATCAAMGRALELAMSALAEPADSDDLAEFLSRNLAELEAQRANAVTKALAASETRARESTSQAAISEDPALAATVVSDRNPRVLSADAKTAVVERKTGAQVPQERKRPRPSPAIPSPSAPAEDSKLVPTQAALTTHSMPPKRGGIGAWWLMALAAAFAGAWFVWPGGARIGAVFTSEPPYPYATDEGAANAASSPSAPAPAVASIAATSGESAPASASASATPSAVVSAAPNLPSAPLPRAPGRRLPTAAPAATAPVLPPADEPDDDPPY